jgi:hypothetical protein
VTGKARSRTHLPRRAYRREGPDVVVRFEIGGLTHLNGPAHALGSETRNVVPSFSALVKSIVPW